MQKNYLLSLFILLFCGGTLLAQRDDMNMDELLEAIAEAESLDEVAYSFNYARYQEGRRESQAFSTLVFPDEWTQWAVEQQMLWLINKERTSRGIKALSGINSLVNQVSKKYAVLLAEHDVIGHNYASSDELLLGPSEDFSPASRIKSSTQLSEMGDLPRNREVVDKVRVKSEWMVPYLVFKWLYVDSTDDFAKRSVIFDNSFIENTGNLDEEGHLGMGFKTNGEGATLVVLNYFDPSGAWEQQQNSNESYEMPLRIYAVGQSVIIEIGDFEGETSFSIHDILGQPVQQGVLSPNSRMEVNITKHSGYYFVSVKSSTSSTVRRVLIN